MNQYLIFGKNQWAKNLSSKVEKQKFNRSASEDQIFINKSTGKTCFIKQVSEQAYNINGEMFIKKLPVKVITITKKVKVK
jgi:hypothetical protein